MVLSSGISAASKGGVIGGTVLLVLALGQKLAGIETTGGAGALVWFVGPVVAVTMAVAAASLIRAMRTRRENASDVAVASVIDVRLKLHDRLSTAVAVEHRTDCFAQAAVAEGLRSASDGRVIEGVARAVPVEFPRRWWVGPTLAGAAIALWLFLPGVHWASPKAASADDGAELAAARAASKVQVAAIQSAIDANPELNKAMAAAAQEKSALAPRTDDELRSPDEIRRETTRQVNELSKRLDEILKSEQAQQLDAMKDALSRVEASESGPLQKLAEALKRADPQAAKAALESLQKTLENGMPDEAARKTLGEALDRLAKQLDEASGANDSLRKALESAGLDGDLAKNSAAAKKAIEGAKGLNESQKQALQQALEAQRKAGEKLEKIAKACKSMSSQCKNPGSGKGAMASACKGGSESLSEMEMLDEMLKDAESARGQCQGGTAGSTPGQSSMNSQGGLGIGGTRTKESTATGTKLRKERVALNGGDVIARQLVDAPPMQGESRAVVERLSGEIGSGYEDGTEDDPVPANLRDIHKQYFGNLKRTIDKKGSKDSSPPTTAPAPVPAKAE